MLNLNILGLDVPDVLPPQGGSRKFTQSSPLPLKGEYKNAHEISHEKGWHRTAAYMYASGAKLKTIAFELGVSEAQVGLVSRQQSFRDLVAHIVHSEFSDDISQMIKAGAMEAIIVMRDLATNGVKEEVKLKASQDLLDRHRGKATNFVHHTTGKISEDPLSELSRLEEDLGIKSETT